METLNGYVVFYNSKRYEVYAKTPYEAKKKVMTEQKIKAKHSNLVAVVLAEKGGNTVTHTPDF